MGALREIAAHFGVEFDGKALEQGESVIEGFVGKLKGVATTVAAGFAVEKIFEFTVGLTETADALAKQSRVLGISMGELQEWGYIADLAGVKASQITGAITKLNMAGSNKKVSAGIRELGIDMKDSGGNAKPAAKLFEEIGDKLHAIEDPTKRAQMAMKTLGKSGTKLLPVFEDGAEGIAELRKEFQELGGGFSDDFGKQSEIFNDNITRIKTMARQVAINVVNRLLPAFTKLSAWFVKQAKWVIPFIKDSRMMETVLTVLAVGGVMKLSGALGGLGGAMNKLLLKFLPLIIAFLLLEDLIGFFNGDESLTGDILENFFGKEATEKVRGLFKDIKDTVNRFIAEIKGSPLTLLDDWEVFTTQLSKDVTELFGPTFGGILNTGGGMFTTFLDLLTGGWDNFTNKIGAIWAIGVLALRIPLVELSIFATSIGASIKDVFFGVWNSIIQGAMKAIGLFGKVATAVGANGIAKDIAKLQDGLAGFQGSETHGEDAQSAAYKRRMGLAAEYDSAQATLAAGVKGGLGGVGGNTTTSAQVIVNVPPGTPAEQAKALAQAAKTGTQQALALPATAAATTAGGLK